MAGFIQNSSYIRGNMCMAVLLVTTVTIPQNNEIMP